MLNYFHFLDKNRQDTIINRWRVRAAQVLTILALIASLAGHKLIGANASSISKDAQAVPARSTTYYLADRVLKKTDFAVLANWGVNTAIVDFDVNGSASAWRAAFESARAANVNIVIWPSDWNNPRPNCGWEAPYPVSANGDIAKVKRLLDTASQYSNFIGIVNAHESFWTCDMSFDEMAGLKDKLKAYALSKGRAIKVWNYIDNLYDKSMLPDNQIERIMDVAVTWQHCAGNVEGTCNTSSKSSALNMILSDRKRIDASKAQVELVFLMQTFTTRGYSTKFTLDELQKYSCQFLDTSALDGFAFYTWDAGWWPDLHSWKELQPAIPYIYNNCVNSPSASAPRVTSIVRAGPNPTSAASVKFTVTFSKPVKDVDAADFQLTTGSGLANAAVSGVSGSGSVYTVTVKTGAGSGPLRLDIPPGATIADLQDNPLAGLPFTGGQPYTIVATAAFTSIPTQDGYALEASETSGAGGRMNNASATLRLGDDAARRQYRSVLSFVTGANLPDNAVVAKVTLRVKWQGVNGGGDPVRIFQGILADIKKGVFKTAALELPDFRAAPDKPLGLFTLPPCGGWSALILTAAKAFVNKLDAPSGLTQIRLRFKLDDNNNKIANFLSLFSGNADANSRPQLIVQYYVP